jgi:hypothetical protein
MGASKDVVKRHKERLIKREHKTMTGTKDFYSSFNPTTNCVKPLKSIPLLAMDWLAMA